MDPRHKTNAVAIVAAIAVTVAGLSLVSGQRARAAGQSGACCLTNGLCVVISAAQCAGNGGTYQGDGTTCGGNCGACCLPGGSCIENASPNACTAQQGTHQGPATTCAGVQCPVEPQGACCLPTASCEFGVEEDCTNQGGIWHGEGTVCGDFNQNGADDVCETIDACPTDINKDGMSDVLDLLELLGHWLGVCP